MNRLVLFVLFILVAFGPAQAQTAPKQPAPPTLNGKLALNGTWNLVGEAGGILIVDWENGISDLEHAAQGHKNVPKATKWPTVGLTDHKLPYQPWALARRNERTANYLHPQKRDQVDTNTLCYPTGMPHLMYRGAVQIQVFDDSVVMLWEHSHGSRIIPTDGRAHLSSKVKLWQGDSVGHWEGNSLVVDVTNLNGYAWLDFVGNFITDAAHLTERFTLVDAKTLNYQLTITDPQAFTQPVKLDMNYSQRASDDIWEFACWEGNRNSADLPK